MTKDIYLLANFLSVIKQISENPPNPRNQRSIIAN